MATLIFPLLLILGAFGGLIVILVRRRADIREAMREAEDEAIRTDVHDSVLSPRNEGFQPPREGLIPLRNLISSAGKNIRTFFSGRFIRGIGIGVKTTVLFVARVFHRVPTAVRMPRMRRRQQRVEEGEGSQEHTPTVRTTADVQRTSGSPLRYPEPLPRSTYRAKNLRMIKPAEAEESAHLIESVEKVSVTLEDIAEPPFVEEHESQQSSAGLDEKLSAPEEEKESISVSEDSLVMPPVRAHRPRQRRATGRRRVPRAARVAEEQSIIEETPQEEGEKDVSSVRPPRIATRLAKSFFEKPAEDINDISSLIEREEYGKAEMMLIDILSKNPRDTAAYRQLGTVYFRRGEISQAQEVFEEALRREPNLIGVHGPLGMCYLELGQYAKALPMFQRAHDEDETNVEILEHLLKISSRMDRRPLMRVTAKKLIALNPEHIEAKKALSRVGAR